MERIVVGFDGSEHARKALARAADLAGDGTEVRVVCAADIARLHRDPAGGAAPSTRRTSRRVPRRSPRPEATSGSGESKRSSSRASETPADVIVQEAEDPGADLIVVGTRGLNAAKRLVLGSTSTNVVHHAPCDVLVVR